MRYFGFEKDDERIGEDLNRQLEGLDVGRLNGALERLDNETMNEVLLTDFRDKCHRAEAFGFGFHFDSEQDVLIVDSGKI